MGSWTIRPGQCFMCKILVFVSSLNNYKLLNTGYMYCVAGGFCGSIKQSRDKLYDPVKEHQCYQLSPLLFPCTLRGQGD